MLVLSIQASEYYGKFLQEHWLSFSLVTILIRHHELINTSCMQSSMENPLPSAQLYNKTVI